MSEENKYGLILEGYKGGCLFGADSKIDNKIVIRPDASWMIYKPDNELQRNKKFDTWNCVAFSACNCIEIIFNRLIKEGLLKYYDYIWMVKKGYIVNGQFNVSDRFVGALAGTEVGKGNSGRKVGDTIYENGLVPESLYPFPDDMDENEYYQDVPQELIDLGKEFLERFNLRYEQVWAQNFNEALKYAPIQVFVYAWEKNSEGIYISPVGKVQNHAVVKIRTGEKQIFDHYNPFIKTLDKGFMYYGVGFKYFVESKNNNNMKLIKGESSTVFLVDEEGNKHAFYDEEHFNSVAPIFGLAKRKEDNNNQTDWSQIKSLSDEEVEKYPLKRPIFIIN